MRVVRINEFVEEEDSVEWLIDGLLPDVGWTLLVGERGLGKTTFAVQLCAALQAGTPFLERETVATSILYIQADSPTIEWREMLRRMAPHSKGLSVVDVPTKCLDNPEYCGYISNVTQRVKPGFVVFDSLYNLTATPVGNEGVLHTVELMKSIANDKPWLLIHHPPHNESRAAGHHSLPANCSNEWQLLKTKLKIEKGRLVKDKEILLQRSGETGLWSLKKDELTSTTVTTFRPMRTMR